MDNYQSSIINYQLDRNRGFNRRPRVVIDKLKVLELEFKKVLHIRVHLHRRELTRFAGKLLASLVKMVAVQVQVAEGMHLDTLSVADSTYYAPIRSVSEEKNMEPVVDLQKFLKQANSKTQEVINNAAKDTSTAVETAKKDSSKSESKAEPKKDDKKDVKKEEPKKQEPKKDEKKETKKDEPKKEEKKDSKKEEPKKDDKKDNKSSSDKKKDEKKS